MLKGSFKPLAFKKDETASALIPKFILVAISFLIRETETATNSPVFSSTIGPPLLPELIDASIWIWFELSFPPFNALIIPEFNFKSSLSLFPNGYPAAIILWSFLGSLPDILIKFLFLILAFNKAKSKFESEATSVASMSCLL